MLKVVQITAKYSTCCSACALQHALTMEMCKCSTKRSFEPCHPEGGREYSRRPQSGGLHAVLVLSDSHSRVAPPLVQIPQLPSEERA